MARKSTGSVRLIRGQWHARFTLPTGQRSDYIALDPQIRDEAGARALAARMAAKVRAAGVDGANVETVAVGQREDFWRTRIADDVRRAKSILGVHNVVNLLTDISAMLIEEHSLASVQTSRAEEQVDAPW